MELDVHLSRSGDEPWGFRLIGGSDYGMPLTVAKVVPNSPASDAGLSNGDTVLRIQDQDSSGFTHEDAKAVMMKADKELVVGVVRGLYDPVLDDYEPIYEPIDQEDFDQPSHPTEVPFQIQNFSDDPNYALHLPEFQDLNQSISRSLTASPFILSSKPYRPFSTEPIPPTDVPPLEDPIILNASHHDDFSKHDDSNLEEFLPPTRFKLPISKQYDPDGSKKNKTIEKVNYDHATDIKEINIEGFRNVCLEKRETFVDEVKKEIANQQTKECHIDEVSRNSMITKGEVKSFEQTKQNWETVESTAGKIVDDSIEKAMSVAQEIKNEIDVELRASAEKTISESDIKLLKKTAESSIESKSTFEATETIEKVESKKVNTETVAKESNLTDEIKLEITKENEHQRNLDVSKQVEIFEKVLKSENVSDKQMKTSNKAESISMNSESIKKSNIIDNCQELDTKTKSVSSNRSESTQQRVISSATETKDTKSKMSTARLLAEQRAYTIGLQTIPQIRGTVHSSYHYNLLLKTFFIHLTDVMVALSRFILAEPVLSEDVKQEAKETTTQTESVVADSVKISNTSSTESRQSLTNKTDSLQQTQNKTESTQVMQSSEVQESVVQQTISASTKQEQLLDKEVDEVIQKRKISGSRMAQLTERKSAELTDRMDAVISEFQTKTGTEEIKDELSLTETELKMTASKVSQDVSDKVSSEMTSLSASETKNVSIQSKQEIREAKRQEREGKQTYVAIVESHVYTNEDTILEDHQFSGLTSETASVQSPNESQTVVEILEAFDTAKTQKIAQLNQEVVKIEQMSAFDNKFNIKQAAVQEKEVSQTVQNTSTFETESVVRNENKEIFKAEEVIENATAKSVQKVLNAKTNFQEVTNTLNEVQNFVVPPRKMSIEKSDQETVAEMKSQKIDVQEHSVQEFSSKSEVIEMIKESNSAEKVEVSNEIINTMEEKITLPQVVELKSVESQVKSTAMKITKEQVTEVPQEEINQKEEVLIKNQIEVEDNQMYEAHVSSVEQHTFDTVQTDVQESNFTAQAVESEIQESTFTAKSVQEHSETLSFTAKFTEEITQESTFTAKSIDTEKQESYFTAKSIDAERQESSFTTKSTESMIHDSFVTGKSIETHQYDASQLKLDLKKDYPLDKQSSQSSIPSEISTPTPSRVPPTPLTDEYMFNLNIPLPTSPGGTPYPCGQHELSPIEEPMIEDPHFVKKKLVPHIDLTIESKIFDPPLPSPPNDKVSSPVYTKPGLRGGGNLRVYKKEEIREIERKSSLLTSAIDETIRNIEQYKQQVANEDQLKSEITKEDSYPMFNGYSKLVDSKVFENGITKSTEVAANNESSIVKSEEVTEDPIKGYRPVEFNPDEIIHMPHAVAPVSPAPPEHGVYKTEEGEVIGSHQGIIDGLEAPIVDQEMSKKLGKPGMTEEKIAELMSGESEMLREAHVMGLSRVLKSHMHRPGDDSSVDFKKIKPIIEKLKDSEVIRALNDELINKTKETKKKDEKKWTTFLQKPSRPVPRVKFGYPGWTTEDQNDKDTYKVKIVKQPKPKIAPDYKPEDFETGPLPWEERALNEPPAPPVEPEEPILIPEETPEFLEAVDPLPESEVPDLEDTGIPLPPPVEDKPEALPEDIVNLEEEEPQELDIEAVVEETEQIVEEMEQNKIADQLMNNVQNMVDPNAPLDQQLKQMQAQIAALAQLPCVIQQTLELVTKQLSQMTTMESTQRIETNVETESVAENTITEVSEVTEMTDETIKNQPDKAEEQKTTEVPAVVVDDETAAVPAVTQPSLTEEEMAKLKMEEREMLDEQQRIEKQKKELMEQMKIELNGRQIKQRPTPRVGKPAPMFGPLTPQERPVVLPGGRKWRNPKDAYNEQFFTETLSAQAELIQGKTKGLPFESDRLPYDERINFLKYEKPPVSLDHLKNSDTYKLIHDMETGPMRGVEMRTPVMAEADYREEKPPSFQAENNEKRIIATFIAHLRNADL